MATRAANGFCCSDGRAPEFATAGTLEEWRELIACLAIGNSRLVLAGSRTAFAGPLITYVARNTMGPRGEGSQLRPRFATARDDRAGFRRAGGDGASTYYVLPESWASEVCKGFNASLIARAMIERGSMERGEGKNLAKRESVPGFGRPRLYVVTANFLTREDETEGETDASC